MPEVMLGMLKCKEPECTFVTDSKAKLGAHTRWQHPKNKKSNNHDYLADELSELVGELREIKGFLIGGKLRQDKEEVDTLVCPVCQGKLELVSSTPRNVGLYFLKCNKCYKEA